MSAGRPPHGLKHVDRLPGPQIDKKRLRIILQTLSGELNVVEACQELEISEARFHLLRRKVLEGALAALHSGPVGRPPKREPVPTRQQELETEVHNLKFELQMAEVREEIALTMPELLKKRTKKNREPHLPRNTARGKPDGGPDG